MVGIVSANQVLGNNLISENIAAFSDIFGGKSGQYRSKLDELIEDARKQLISKATAMNANAIVGFSVSTNQISAKGMSMFMVTATGTAVIIETDRYDLLEKLHKLNTYRSEGILSQEEYEYEQSRIKKLMGNVIATEAKAAIEIKRVQELEEAERKRKQEEAQKKYEEEHATELKAKEEAKRKYEAEHADDIRKKAELLDFVNTEFPKRKNEVEKVDLSAVANATYEEIVPKIDGLTHYEIMRYLVSIGNTTSACKYYCDKYNLSAADAKDYLLGIYRVI